MGSVATVTSCGQPNEPKDARGSRNYNGAKLTDVESMTVRVAIETLANVLAEGLELESDGVAFTDRYAALGGREKL
jgi:hypothetical protein